MIICVADYTSGQAGAPSWVSCFLPADASASLGTGTLRGVLMRYNRSVPPCEVIPVVYYPDPSAAAEWLMKAFGFTVRLRIANHRIQMRAGQGCFTVAEGDTLPNHSCVVQVRIENALGHCERARLAGAKILSEPKDHVYGERQYGAEDFFGHRWDFTETLADVEPESWGGTSVAL